MLKNDASENFITHLKNALVAKPAAPMLTAGINTAYANGIQNQRKVDGTEALTAFDGKQPIPHLLKTDVQTVVQTVLNNPTLLEEVFGPSTIAIIANDMDELIHCCKHLEGQLTATIHGTENEFAGVNNLIQVLQSKAGRLVLNGFPTGVEVCHAMVHGGPFPATADARTTSVGTQAIYRFTRPVCYQDFPQSLLPHELKDANSLGITRMVNGKTEMEIR